MSDLVKRQFELMRVLLDDYKSNKVSLNLLIQRIEGLSRAAGNRLWEDSFFDIVLNLESINSELIENKRLPSKHEEDEIRASVEALEKVITTTS
jgi:hypothetical protein